MARRQEVARPACHLEFGGDATPAHAAALQAEAEANLVAAGRALLHPALGAAVHHLDVHHPEARNPLETAAFALDELRLPVA